MPVEIVIPLRWTADAGSMIRRPSEMIVFSDLLTPVFFSTRFYGVADDHGLGMVGVSTASLFVGFFFVLQAN